MNQKLKNNNLIDSMITRLEKAELSETLHNDHFHNVTWPILKNNDIMKKFGQLSQADQDRMVQDAQAVNADASNPAKLTQMIYGSALSSRVRLSTFLDARKPIEGPTQESFYTNYKISVPLFEDNIQVKQSDALGSVLILEDPTEIRAYVRTSYRTLYISSTESGQYKDYATASASPKSAEGQKAKAYATAISEQVRAAAVAELGQLLKDPQDAASLKSLMASKGLYPVLLDSITFAIIDLLNQGTFSTNYGDTFKAAQALLANNLLSDAALGYSTLRNKNQELANAIVTKVSEVKKQINPYLVNKADMIAAFTKARSVHKPHSSAINSALNNFANMVSTLQNTLSTKIDFDALALLPADQKAEYFYNLFPSHIYRSTNIDKTHLINAFVCITAKRLQAGQAGGVAIGPKTADGILFTKVAGTDRLVGDPKDRSIKSAVISDGAHRHIENEALKNYGVLTGQTYALIADSMDTTASATTNAGEGETNSPKAQFLNILSHLYDPNSRQLRSDTVLFALVPKLILEGAHMGLKTSLEPFYQTHHGFTLEELYSTGSDQTASQIYSSLIPMKDIYDNWMAKMLTFDTPKEELREFPRQFITMVQNLHRGIWAHDQIQGFGVFSAIDIDRIRSEISLSDNMFSAEQIAISKSTTIRKFREASNG